MAGKKFVMPTVASEKGESKKKEKAESPKIAAMEQKMGIEKGFKKGGSIKKGGK